MGPIPSPTSITRGHALLFGHAGDRIDLSAFELNDYGDVNARGVLGGVLLDLRDAGGGTILLRGLFSSRLEDLNDLDFPVPPRRLE